jgi:dephospho-CoA kinase
MNRCFIALLGGIGSGKSTVGRLFTERGAEVIEADQVGHAVLDGPAYEEVADLWPAVAFDGRIDRGMLASVVFGSGSELRRLEGVTHPHIQSEIASMVLESEARIVVVELPVIMGIIGGSWLRVVVDAPSELRVRRLLSRGMEYSDAVERMAAQPARSEWLEYAHVVIDNSKDLTALSNQVNSLIDLITAWLDD